MSNPCESLIDALKSEPYIRVTNKHRWLVFDDTLEDWVVYEQLPYAKHSRTVYQGQDLANAAFYLTRETKE